MSNQTVLISGASTGIGRALSLELARQGCRVFAGVRNPADGEALQSQASAQLTPLILDVSQPDSIASACARVAEQTGGDLYCLVNNAGVSIGAALEYLPLSEFRQQLEVNLVGQLALTQASLPMLRAINGSRIFFISSVGGRVSMPFNGPYSASKAALISLADTLRLELAPWPIFVTTFVVASVQTPIWQKAAHTAGKILRSLPPEALERYGELQKRAGAYYRDIGEHGMPVDQVVNVISQELKRPHPREMRYVGGYALLIELMARFLPIRWRDALVRRQMRL